MAKFKIHKQEIIQMIKEEYSKKLTEIKLKNRLHKINEEIKSIISEDENLEEVEAGGKEGVRSTGWTGEKGGDEKWKPQFQKKGSHLVEDESPEEEMPFDENPSDEMPSEEMPSDEFSTDEFSADDESLEGDLDIEAILAQLADAIEDKIESTVNEKVGGSPEGEEIPSDEISVDDKMSPESEEGSETGEEDLVKEQDGTSVAQEQKPKNATPYDNGAATIPKTGQLVSEGLKKRMQILSGMIKNDFND